MPDPSSSSRYLLEISAGSVDDVKIADRAGADRIELNSALALGGLTPSPGTLKLALANTKLPVIGMCRPRPSGFCYSLDEYQTLLADVDACLAAGCQGVAFGVLTAQREIDQPRCRELVKRCGGQDAVFHRAFDLTANPREAVRTLIDCGVTRVMTSGGQATAGQGSELISDLVSRYGHQVTILAAGGIRPDNLTDLLNTGVREIHAGPGIQLLDQSQPPRGSVRFDAPTPENPAHYRSLSDDLVRQMVAGKAPKSR